MHFKKVLGCFGEMNGLQGEMHIYNIVKGRELYPPGGEVFGWSILKVGCHGSPTLCECEFNS